MIDKEAKEIEQAFLDLDRLFFSGRKNKIYQVMLTSLDKFLITNALKITCGNQKRAAKLLGINRNTLRAKARKLGISVKEEKL